MMSELLDAMMLAERVFDCTNSSMKAQGFTRIRKLSTFSNRRLQSACRVPILGMHQE